MDQIKSMAHIAEISGLCIESLRCTSVHLEVLHLIKYAPREIENRILQLIEFFHLSVEPN